MLNILIILIIVIIPSEFRLLDLFRTVFPYCNKLNRLTMDTEKVYSIKHCHVDVMGDLMLLIIAKSGMETLASWAHIPSSRCCLINFQGSCLSFMLVDLKASTFHTYLLEATDGTAWI
jgi:hypothetical protein